MNASPETVNRIVAIASAMADRGAEKGEIVDQTPLTEVFDSFAIFELIVDIETEFGAEIDIGAIDDDTPLSAATFATIVDAQR